MDPGPEVFDQGRSLHVRPLRVQLVEHLEEVAAELRDARRCRCRCRETARLVRPPGDEERRQGLELRQATPDRGGTAARQLDAARALPLPHEPQHQVDTGGALDIGHRPIPQRGEPLGHVGELERVVLVPSDGHHGAEQERRCQRVVLRGRHPEREDPLVMERLVLEQRLRCPARPLQLTRERSPHRPRRQHQRVGGREVVEGAGGGFERVALDHPHHEREIRVAPGCVPHRRQLVGAEHPPEPAREAADDRVGVIEPGHERLPCDRRTSDPDRGRRQPHDPDRVVRLQRLCEVDRVERCSDRVAERLLAQQELPPFGSEAHPLDEPVSVTRDHLMEAAGRRRAVPLVEPAGLRERHERLPPDRERGHEDPVHSPPPNIASTAGRAASDRRPTRASAVPRSKFPRISTARGSCSVPTNPSA